MDEAAAEAMWADTNINTTQQQIVKMHLRYYFGKRIFIAEKNSIGDYLLLCPYFLWRAQTLQGRRSVLEI
jgi:hypothetical protein